MRVSAKAEYACVAMIELARNYTERQPVRIKAIADAHGIPQRFLVQILLQLKGAGLVVSARGAAGGYQLARPPHAISLGEIMQVIDAATPPRPEPGVSGLSPAMQAVRGVWHEIQLQERRLLDRCTLTELAHRVDQANSLTYQI